MMPLALANPGEENLIRKVGGSPEVKKHLENRGIAYHDFGCSSTESVDYPIYGKKVAEAVARGEFEKGILIFKFKDRSNPTAYS